MPSVRFGPEGLLNRDTSVLGWEDWNILLLQLWGLVV